ncbi:MAG: DNA-processing protein DprA [Coriobacteriia bacterium]|nr:DNA-processing protein DprA [Coriobacteriia bacterium]MCL2750634.1 DNA-processing protein DprA [Coriobacteriia bacterium]
MNETELMVQDKRASSRMLYDEAALESKIEQKLPQRSELLQSSKRYPQQLLQLKDAPEKLYALGNVDLLSEPALAIVGARKATTYGLDCAARFARRAAKWGITVVSGGAIGCDMAAHRGALDAGGNTIVVLGSGADVVYPLRARALLREVLDAGGTLLSEAPWGSAPLRWAFSKRNRIIASLASATLIVEAGLPSGTFQTADHTLSLGNDVLVVPGPIFSSTCKGTNRLLVQGALPVVDNDSFDDILERIFDPVNYKGISTATSQATLALQEETPESGQGEKLLPEEIKLRQITNHIMRDISASPMTIDALASAYGKEAVEIVRVITKLEINGQAERLRDGRYMARPPRSA